MKKNRLFTILSALILCAFWITGCDKNMPEIKEIGVESISLVEELREGILMEIGQATDIAWKINILPENATDRAESFSSSNTDVATVNAKGKLTANAEGTSEITITAGGKSVSFTLTVVDKIPVNATQIGLAIPNLDLMAGATYNLRAQVTVTPSDANDGLDFTSSAPAIVTVNSEGVLTGVSAGSATITVASRHNASIKATLPVTVTVFSGDYLRTGWTMTASHTLFKTTADAEKNSLASALDGDLTTNFCMVRPGKNFGNVPNVSVPSGDALYFVVDMQAQKEVNYFRIRHKNSTEAFIRWYGFDKIQGSNDGQNFTDIATNIVVANAGTAAEQESPNITFPKSTYRYFKFYAKEARCFYSSSYTSQGSSVQIQELYLGINP